MECKRRREEKCLEYLEDEMAAIISSPKMEKDVVKWGKRLAVK